MLKHLHPTRPPVPKWHPDLVAQMLPLARKYDLQTIMQECKAQYSSFQFSSSPTSPLYALTWLGYAEQYQVG